MDSRLSKRRVVFDSLAGRSANIFTGPDGIYNQRMLRLLGTVSVLSRDNVSFTHVEEVEF
jgi:hypothetical protein